MAFEGLTPLTPAQALPRLQGVAHLDPDGLATPEGLVAAGPAFELRAQGGAVVFVLVKKGPQLWIEAAKGAAADDLTVVGLATVEAIAAQARCTSVGFQTMRRGLVRKATRLGYLVNGRTLEKALQ